MKFIYFAQKPENQDKPWAGFNNVIQRKSKNKRSF